MKHAAVKNLWQYTIMYALEKKKKENPIHDIQLAMGKSHRQLYFQQILFQFAVAQHVFHCVATSLSNNQKITAISSMACVSCLFATNDHIVVRYI
jgi:hypothetical protein